KNQFWRSKMSELKSSITETYPDFINSWIVQRIRQSSESSVAFVDIREPYNIELFKDFCLQSGLTDFSTIFVEGDVIAEFDNPSDTYVRNYDYDIVIDNRRKDLDEGEAISKLEIEACKFVEENILIEVEGYEGRNNI